jgi:hypothetical protein
MCERVCTCVSSLQGAVKVRSAPRSLSVCSTPLMTRAPPVMPVSMLFMVAEVQAERK